jgi:hypothetical protein
MNKILKNLKQESLNNAVADANKAHQIVVTTRRKHFEDLRMIFKTRLAEELMKSSN